MRTTRCRKPGLLPKLGDESQAASGRAAQIPIRMNKFERQSRQPADQQTLPEAIAGEFAHLPAGIVEVSDAPPIQPRAPLTPGEVRTILMSLMLTMFLAALDQTLSLIHI